MFGPIFFEDRSFERRHRLALADDVQSHALTHFALCVAVIDHGLIAVRVHRSPELAFDFADVKLPNTAFKEVVRHLKYDVAELAIVTYLQAKAHGKPLTLLPAVIVGALPHPFLVYNAERAPIAPADLPGRRVGIRAYSVTTAAWIRG